MSEMIWLGISGTLALALGIALVAYGRRFPAKKQPVGNTARRISLTGTPPLPSGPADQRRAIVRSGVLLCFIASTIVLSALAVAVRTLLR